MLKTPVLFTIVYIKNYGKNGGHLDSFFMTRDDSDIRVTIKLILNYSCSVKGERQEQVEKNNNLWMIESMIGGYDHYLIHGVLP